jgi:predicted nucleic acid-binding protein
LHAQAVYLATYDQKHLLSQRDAIRTAFGLVVATPEEILSAH